MEGRTSARPRSRGSATLLDLAERAADAGDYGRVSALFAAARQRGVAGAEAGRWQRVLVEAGDFAAAEAAGGPAAGDTSATVAVDAPGGEGDDFLDFEPGARERPQLPVDPGLVARFLEWFAGRGDVYARQWFDARRDRGGYWPVREPLTERVAVDHLLGRLTLGQYVLHPDDTVSFAAFDLDPTAEALDQARLATAAEPAGALPLLLDHGCRIARAASDCGLAGFAEDSGGAGVHVWLFFRPRLAAAPARVLLRELAWRAGAQPPGVRVELFPKQDQLTGKGLGNLIKLPLGVHQATLRRSRLLDAAGRPLDDGAALDALAACDPVAVERLLARRVVPLREPARADSAPPAAAAELRAPSGPTPRALAAALAAVPAGKEAAQAFDRIVAGCAVVRELARRAAEGEHLPAEAARALLYSAGLVGRDNPRVDEILARAGLSRHELERVRHGLQGPIGCRRLHEGFPDIARGCACPQPEAGGYATPALFALRARPSHDRVPQSWPALEDFAADGAASEAVADRLARIEAALGALLAESTAASGRQAIDESSAALPCGRGTGGRCPQRAEGAPAPEAGAEDEPR